MNNTELIAEAREIADSTEGWLNSMPPYERNSSDRDFDRRTLTILRATADALEAIEQEVSPIAASRAVVAAINARLDVMLHPYSDTRIPKVKERDSIRELYGENIVNDIEAILSQSPTDALKAVKEAAWDEGHKSRWRRGPDTCLCGAYSSGECACGEYGNGELLSLGDNPYRVQP